MKDTIKDWLKFFALVLLFFCIGFIGGVILRRNIKPVKVVEKVVVRTDTLTVRDTIRIDHPVYIRERIVDTMFVAVTETKLVRDTIFMALPREQKEYSDTTYHAWVSGYQPALDSIVVRQLTKYVTTTIREPGKHWHIGITGGYGATLQGNKVMLSPYVGAGITYSIFSF